MSKLLANQIANYNDNGPVEAKEGLNIPTSKPLQVAGSPGANGQYLKSTGTGLGWETFPTIPAAQLNTDWNATSGISQILNKPTFSVAASTGDYSDLLNKPTIPAAQVNSDWNATSGISQILNKPNFFSGNYLDLSNKPTIPATITDLADVNLPTTIADNTYLRWDTNTARWVPGTGAAGIAEVKEDLSPELGGDLQLNAKDIIGDTSSVVSVRGQNSKLRFHYNNLSDLPSATDWHGMFAHVHATGRAYFAHGGAWISLAMESELTVDTDTTYSHDSVADAVGVNLRLNSSGGFQDDILVTAGTGIIIDNISSSGFTINSTGGGGGGGATVTTDDSAPGGATDGDLWWKSDEGRLKVYYSDGDTTQWVDASPPLAPSVLVSGNSKVITETTAGAGENAVEIWGGNLLRWRFRQDGTLLPAANSAYDIGSNSYKVRDLFLDSNSLHIGSVDISESSGQLVVPPLQLTGHVIPDTNEAYDLGSAEYKIRHLFLSDNTLYYEGEFLKVAQHNAGGSAQAASYLIPLAKLKDALNASADYEAFKTAILAITDA
jgi:drug/metabolite transporter superfamily protein YnfA